MSRSRSGDGAPSAPSDSLSDLSAEELRNVAARCDRALQERPALLVSSLQYRLCEVGQGRLHPRALVRALEELANNARPRRGRVLRGVAVPRRGVATRDDLTSRVAAGQAEAAVALGRGLAAQAGESAVESLARTVHRALAARESAEAFGDEPATTVRAAWDAEGGSRGASYRYSAPDPVVGLPPNLGAPSANAPGARLLRFAAAGPRPPLLVWVSNALGWLGPDDPTLWRLLGDAAAAGARLAVVARAVDLQTFAVLKRTGAVAVRAHQWFVDGEPDAAAVADARTLRWPPLRDAAGERAAAVAERVAGLRRAELAAAPTADQVAAVETGLASGLHDPERTGPGALLAWAQASDAHMHPHWTHAVRRWAAWAPYRAPAGRTPLG